MGLNLLDVNGLISKVQNKVNEETNNLMASFDPYNMDESAIDSKIEEYTSKIDKVQEYANTVSTTMKVIKAIKDPTKAIDLGKDLVIEQLNNNETYQNLKAQVIEKAKEKVMEIPQVKDLADKVQQKIDDIQNVDIPDDVKSVLGNPEDLAGETPNATKYIYQALIDTGLTRQMISIANERDAETRI